MKTEISAIEIVSTHALRRSLAMGILNEIKQADSVDFTLALGATAISDLDGVSAAGASAADRRLTPKLDAEALVHGKTASGAPLPSSPLGVTSPVVITRACMNLVPHSINIVDCGTFVPPDMEHISLGCSPGKNVIEENSLDIEQVRHLFQRGKEMGAERISMLRQESDGQRILPVIAECVPGGTTTALGLLKALDIKADSLLSSSVPGKRTGQAHVVALALQRLEKELGAGVLKEKCQLDPLLAVSYLGDPMQAFAAGFVLGAIRQSKRKPGPKALVLAGGSQMLAVYALAAAMAKKEPVEDYSRLLRKQVAVITTKWVAYDPFGNTPLLSMFVDAPYIAACPDFTQSRHAGLRAYEQGHVKEGVGAGASMVLASLLGSANGAATATNRGLDEKTIVKAIDTCYEEMIL